MIPSPWIGVVLALACFRLARLAGWDDFPPVVVARDYVTRKREYRTGSQNAQMGLTAEPPRTTVSYGRPLLAHMLHCAYCTGFWISLAAYLLWVFFPTETLYGAAPFALSAAVGITARMLDP